MNIAYIILAHNYPEQLLRLLLRLKTNSTSFFIHIDRRNNRMYREFINKIPGIQNVFLIKRYRCYWGNFNIVKATLEGIKSIVDSGIDFDYAVLLSGQDYLLKPPAQIESFLQKHKGKEFMEFFALDSKNKWSSLGGNYQALKRVKYWHVQFRSKRFCVPIERDFPRGFEPYGGSQWWCLSRECIEYINIFIKENQKLVNFFKYVFIPDEICLQTIILNSPFKDKVINDDLRYIDWKNPNPKVPAILEKKDFDNLMSSQKLFARKFSMTRDAEILDMLDKKILNYDDDLLA